MSEYCFTSLFAQLWQYRDRRKPETGIMLYSYFHGLQGFFTAQSTMDSTVYSRYLKSLEHRIYTITITNIRPDRNSNVVPQVISPSRYECAIGTGLSMNNKYKYCKICDLTVTSPLMGFWLLVHYLRNKM